jgi:uncharacterized iron-regulated membrane protein
MPFVYKLHDELALGMTGIWILGIVALVWTLDCGVGFYLTLPAGTHALMLWLWVVLLLFAWSSVYMNLWDTLYIWWKKRRARRSAFVPRKSPAATEEDVGARASVARERPGSS